jgi:hypothetical protein
VKSIGHGIVIDASPSTVWSVLMDWSRFAEWNPFLTELDGERRLGSRLSVRMKPPGGRPLRFHPTLTALEPESRLQWFGRAGLPGVFDRRHTFSLTALPQGRTWFEQAETLTGLLTWFTGSLINRTQRGFKQMNQALAERCQEAPRLQPGPGKSGHNRTS